MDKTLKIEIATAIVESYLEKDIQKMTPIEKIIREQLLDREDRPNERVYERTDFIKKKIDSVCKTFMNNSVVIGTGKSPIEMPNPQFDIYDYSDSLDDLVEFFKTHIEITYEKDANGSVSNRKASYNNYQRINTDNDYTFANNILSTISNGDLSQEIINKERKNLESEKVQIQSRFKINIIIRASVLSDKQYQSNNQKRVDIVSLIPEIVKSMKCNIVVDGAKSFTPKDFVRQNQYYLIWSLWNQAIMYSYHQLCLSLEKKSQSEYDENILSGMKNLSFECNKNENNMDSLADGYYRYIKMIKIRNELLSELQKENDNIYPEDYIFIQKEDIYTNDNARIDNIDNVINGELCRMFHSGTKQCKLETFKNRMKVCKQELVEYSSITTRILDFNDLRTWRAFYRLLYVNKITYDRQTPVNMVKSVVNISKKDEKLNEKHTLISEMLSRGIREEYQIADPALPKFMTQFYSLSLKTLYLDYPRAGCTDKYFKSKIEKLNKTMLGVFEILIKCLE